MLGRTTTVYATTSGYLSVRLPARVPLSTFGGQLKGPTVTVSDPSAFVAAALVAEKPIRRPGDSYALEPTLLAFQLPTGPTWRTFYSSSQVPTAGLPPGDYRLLVITRRPQRITWHLPLATPSLSVRTARNVAAPADIRAGGYEPVALVTSAAHFPTAAKTQIWQFAWMRGTRTGPIHQGSFCVYAGEDEISAATEPAPSPVCNGVGANGGAPIGVGIPEKSGMDELVYGGMTPVDASQRLNVDYLPEVGAKFTVAVSGVADASSTYQLWLPIG
jgi:hypothetical protein